MLLPSGLISGELEQPTKKSAVDNADILNKIFNFIVFPIYVKKFDKGFSITRLAINENQNAMQK